MATLPSQNSRSVAAGTRVADLAAQVAEHRLGRVGDPGRALLRGAAAGVDDAAGQGRGPAAAEPLQDQHRTAGRGRLQCGAGARGPEADHDHVGLDVPVDVPVRRHGASRGSAQNCNVFYYPDGRGRMTTEPAEFDVVVAGSGAAGMTAALTAAEPRAERGGRREGRGVRRVDGAVGGRDLGPGQRGAAGRRGDRHARSGPGLPGPRGGRRGPGLVAAGVPRARPGHARPGPARDAAAAGLGARLLRLLPGGPGRAGPRAQRRAGAAGWRGARRRNCRTWPGRTCRPRWPSPRPSTAGSAWGRAIRARCVAGGADRGAGVARPAARAPGAEPGAGAGRGPAGRAGGRPGAGVAGYSADRPGGTRRPGDRGLGDAGRANRWLSGPGAGC